MAKQRITKVEYGALAGLTSEIFDLVLQIQARQRQVDSLLEVPGMMSAMAGLGLKFGLGTLMEKNEIEVVD